MNRKKLLWLLLSGLAMWMQIEAQQRSTYSLEAQLEQFIRNANLANVAYGGDISKPLVNVPLPSKGSVLRRSIEVWNKSDKPISIALVPLKEILPTSSTGQVLGQAAKLKKALQNPAHLLTQGKRYEVDTQNEAGVPLLSVNNPGLNINKDIIILFALINPQAGDNAKLRMYAFRPHKTIYVRFKDEKGEVILGPQTGPLMGFKGVTETNYPLKDNVKNGDFMEITLTSARKGATPFYKN